MALNQLELIIKETISKYGLHRVAVSHHIGTVPPLEAGVLGELSFKGSPDPRHFMFDTNVGKSRIRHTTTTKID